MEKLPSAESKRMNWQPSVEKTKLFYDLYFTNFIRINQNKTDFIKEIVDLYYDKVSLSTKIDNKPIKVIRGNKKGSLRSETREYSNLRVRVWSETYTKVYRLYNTLSKNNKINNFYQLIEDIIENARTQFESQGIDVISNSHFYSKELKEILNKENS